MGPDHRFTRFSRRAHVHFSKKAMLLLAPVFTLGVTVLAPGVAGATTTPTPPPAAGTAAAPAPQKSTGTTGTTVPVKDTAYWMDASDGAVYAFGGAPNYGSMAGKPLNKPVVGMAAMPTGQGYWLDATDGGIFSFGAAQFWGSMGGSHLNQPIVGMAAMPTGKGYWEVASDGGIFTFGSAQFYGSMGSQHLNQPIVGMTPTATGKGYWLVASDGGIFTFGAARFFGSTGSLTLAKPIVGMATMPTGGGYWLVASDGGIFTFGGASQNFFGSLGGRPLRHPVVGMSALYNGKGYWLADSNGGVTNFGTAQYFGSAPQNIPAPVVGIATGKGNGDPGSTSYQSGSFGYDVSNYQCTGFPPAPHAVGVVQVNGWGDSAPNPCLAKEVTWSGAGLNLYIFLIYGTSSTAEPGCTSAPSPTACNFGYQVGWNDYNTARSTIGSRATVPWWLDVEPSNWSSTTAANRSVVIGAVDALHYAAGINTVGFYFSLDNWNNIVGIYTGPGPLWPAWWTGPTPGYKCTNARTAALRAGDQLPPGPIQLIQYTDNANGFDGDYAC